MEVKCAPLNTISCSVVDVVSFNLTFIDVKRVINYFLDPSLHVGTTCLKNRSMSTKIGAEKHGSYCVLMQYMLFLQIKECIQGKKSLVQSYPTTHTFFPFSTRKNIVNVWYLERQVQGTKKPAAKIFWLIT